MKKYFLKRKLKQLYIKIQTFDGYSCGHSLMLSISSEYFGLCESYNKTADKLILLDPSCPKFRFKID